MLVRRSVECKASAIIVPNYKAEVEKVYFVFISNLFVKLLK